MPATYDVGRPYLAVAMTGFLRRTLLIGILVILAVGHGELLLSYRCNGKGAAREKRSDGSVGKAGNYSASNKAKRVKRLASLGWLKNQGSCARVKSSQTNKQKKLLGSRHFWKA